jgi:hypothetical protein
MADNNSSVHKSADAVCAAVAHPDEGLSLRDITGTKGRKVPNLLLVSTWRPTMSITEKELTSFL